jgi:hypothetical protein
MGLFPRGKTSSIKTYVITHRWSRRFSPLRRVDSSLPVLATEQTFNSSSLKVDREDHRGLSGLLLVIIDWYVLSTELITGSPS